MISPESLQPSTSNETAQTENISESEDGSGSSLETELPVKKRVTIKNSQTRGCTVKILIHGWREIYLTRSNPFVRFVLKLLAVA